MSLHTIHEFATDDPRARITWQGLAYRAACVYRDTDGSLSVYLIQVTKKGTDYKRSDNGNWLTLENSLDKRAEGAELATYVREIADEKILKIDMMPASVEYQDAYGLQLESVGTVLVDGPWARNREFNHRIKVWRDHVTVDTVPTVVALHSGRPVPRLGTVQDGDVVRLIPPTGEPTDYVVKMRRYADPELIPVK